MRLAHILTYVALSTACGRSGSRLTDSARTAAADKVPFLAIGPVDSIVLQRTRCYGACPPYHLRLSRTGAIQFVSLARVDSGRIEAAQIPEETVKELLNAVQDVDFLALPDHIVPDSAMCGPWVTDNPSATVTLYTVRGAPKSVRDYLGCRWAPAPLRRLEEAIDSVSAVDRWLFVGDFTLRTVDGRPPPATVQLQRGRPVRLRSYVLYLNPSGNWTENFMFRSAGAAEETDSSVEGKYTSHGRTLVLLDSMTSGPARTATLSRNADTIRFVQPFANGARHRFVLTR